MDFNDILQGLSVGTAVSSMIAAAALIALVGFSIWAAKKVASFFDDAEDEAPEEYGYENACRKCGNYVSDEYSICSDCER